jgi:hypothetical protein
MTEVHPIDSGASAPAAAHVHEETNPDLESHIPQEVAIFLRALNDACLRGATSELNALYESDREELTTKFYTQNRALKERFRNWPKPQYVRRYLTHPVAAQLYEFIFYRHLFTDRSVKQDFQVKNAWDMFSRLFHMINFSAKNNIFLPNGLLWDFFDEFTYQLCKIYKENVHTPKYSYWNIRDVTKLLDTLVSQTRVVDELKAVKSGAARADSIFSTTNVRAGGGVCALITLIRIDVLLGDYYGALNRAEVLDPWGKGRDVVVSVPPALVSLYYNLGLSYMMLRRYVDANKIFRIALSVKALNRRFVDNIQQQAACLLGTCCILGGLPSEGISAFFTDKRGLHQYEEASVQMTQGNENAFADTFYKNTPEFLSLPVDCAMKQHDPKENKNHQQRMFLREVEQLQQVIQLRGYFKVYRNIALDKVPRLVDASEGDELAALFAMKHKMKQLTHEGSASANLHSGSYKISAAIDFCATTESATVAESAVIVPPEIKLLQRIQMLQARTSIGSPK